MQIVIFPILLFQVLLALHLPHHMGQQQSSDMQYLLALAEKQDQYKSDLQNIQSQINDINKIIQSNSTVGYRLYKLEQAVAQQRDTVYSMENNLTIPFNLKNCTCLQLSGDKIGQLTSKVVMLQSDLDNLEKEVKNCQDCKDLNETRSQISQQQKYLDIINETLHSDCKYVPKQLPNETLTGMVNLNNSYYKDNLNAKNWYYGKLDPKKYRNQIFVRSTQYNLTSCPIQTPYVHYQNNTCFSCMSSGAFNLGQRSCINCPIGMFFNVTTLQCETCQQNKIFNQTTGKCQSCPSGLKRTQNNTCASSNQTSTSNGTSGNSPTNNSQTSNGTANKCPSSTPHWNYVTSKCQECPIGTIYEASTQYCRPTNYIGICPTNKPYYNITKNQCQSCPNGTTYNSATYRCQYSGGSGTQEQGLLCKVDQTYNETTKQCIKTSLLCTADQNYSEKFKRCMNKSQLCEWDQYYNKTSKTCNQIPFITSPYVFNLIYQVSFDKYINLYAQSKQDNPLLEDCPLSKPYFSYLDLKCISCSNEKPYFNLDQGYCQDCAYPTVYNPSGHRCQSIIGSHHRTMSKHKSNQQQHKLLQNLMDRL